MCIRVSENSKRKIPGGGNFAHNSRENYKGHGYQDRGRNKESNYHQEKMGHKEQRGYYKPQMMQGHNRSDPRMKNEQDNYYNQERSRQPAYEEQPRMESHQSRISSSSGTNQQSFLHNPLANNGPSNKMKTIQMGPSPEQESLDHINSIELHQNPSQSQRNYLINEIIQNPSMNELMSMPNNSDGSAVMSYLDQYILPQNASNPVESSVMQSSPSYMSNAGGVQSIPMSNVIGPSNPNSSGRVPVQYSPMPSTSSNMQGWGVTTTGVYNSTPNYMESLIDLCASFRSILPIPKNATNTVYVEGIPTDTKEREVARKSFLSSLDIDMFRPFPGFKSVRLIPRDKKNGEKVIFCFADFENTLQTTMVINTLQVVLFISNSLGVSV